LLKTFKRLPKCQKKSLTLHQIYQMDIKKLVDSYIEKNFKQLEEQRLSPGFNWANVAAQIGINGLQGEYVRGRFRLFKNKYGVSLLLVPTIKERISSIFSTITHSKDDKEKGTKEFCFTADEIPTEEQIIDHFKIDTSRYKINQIYHKTSFGGKYAVTVSLLALKGNKTITVNQDFISKIESIKPYENIELYKGEESDVYGSLIIPKQDAHWNKADIHGNNSMEQRFEQFIDLLSYQINNIAHDLEEIVYVVGSDEFNSEWTDATTRGTPQQNLMSYSESFEKISEFNIQTINLLRTVTPKVKVILLNGNHDHNVSWHLAHLLKHLYKNVSSVEINDSLENTKIYSYYSNLVLLNHGDVIKPKDLAAKFPILAKEQWSDHSNYYCITGDKHHEVSHDFHGIMWYQVPQLSNAKSRWDDKMGFSTSKAELLTFLFERDGLYSIQRKQIR
jgi:hypothetical protein